MVDAIDDGDGAELRTKVPIFARERPVSTGWVYELFVLDCVYVVGFVEGL